MTLTQKLVALFIVSWLLSLIFKPSRALAEEYKRFKQYETWSE